MFSSPLNILSHRSFFQTDFDYFAKMDPNFVRANNRKTRPLKLKKKLYEFYAAPITK